MHVRSYHKRGEMNRTEQDYANYLQLLKLSGEIVDFQYEPETLKLGPDCRYTPDFRVIKDVVEFHEVKGTSKNKPYIEDDALVKIKTASTIHPMYKFIIVYKVQGKWEKREIN